MIWVVWAAYRDHSAEPVFLAGYPSQTGAEALKAAIEKAESYRAIFVTPVPIHP